MAVTAATPHELVTFNSALGWFALAGAGGRLRRVTLGHAEECLAVAALGLDPCGAVPAGGFLRALAERLTDYAAGGRPELGGVPVELGAMGEFRRCVLVACRAIPYGQTLTYGELAAQVGHPAAARAVGGAMAANPCPIVIPCHRVVAASGGLGGFSAPGGVRLKQRLLALERGVLGCF